MEFVEPTRKTIRVREFMSSDLRHPLPKVTYKVDDYAYFHTDDLGRTDHVQVENLELRPTKASAAANRAVVGGAPGMDAGHLLARGMGGAREEINLVRMIRDLNRGWGGRSLLGQNSVRHIELEIERALRQLDPSSSLRLDVSIDYVGGKADSFEFVTTRADGSIVETASTVIKHE